MTKHSLIFISAVALLLPALAFGSVESTLGAIQSRLISTILPLVGIIGLAFAGLSFAVGSPNARQRAIFALVGAAVGFGAPSLIAFIRQIVN